MFSRKGNLALLVAMVSCKTLSTYPCITCTCCNVGGACRQQIGPDRTCRRISNLRMQLFFRHLPPSTFPKARPTDGPTLPASLKKLGEDALLPRRSNWHFPSHVNKQNGFVQRDRADGRALNLSHFWPNLAFFCIITAKCRDQFVFGRLFTEYWICCSTSSMQFLKSLEPTMLWSARNDCDLRDFRTCPWAQKPLLFVFGEPRIAMMCRWEARTVPLLESISDIYLWGHGIVETVF